MKQPRLRHPLLAISLFVAILATTGCQTVRDTLYEPVPYDEVAKERGITLAEAQGLGLVRAKPALQPMIDTASAFIPAPGVAPLASLALNGALALGAIWLGRRKHTAEKVTASLVQGIDTFRDILDQTPQGKQIDARLTQTLRQHQNALQVQKEITKLLERYETPTKTPINLGA